MLSVNERLSLNTSFFLGIEVKFPFQNKTNYARGWLAARPGRTGFDHFSGGLLELSLQGTGSLDYGNRVRRLREPGQDAGQFNIFFAKFAAGGF